MALRRLRRMSDLKIVVDSGLGWVRLGDVGFMEDKMGKAYEHQYFYAGSGSSAGTMTCMGCHSQIDNKTEDWMVYKKDKNYDWSYVCWHRRCREDVEWAKRDAANAKHKADYAHFKDELSAFQEKWKGWDIIGEIEDSHGTAIY